MVAPLDRACDRLFVDFDSLIHHCLRHGNAHVCRLMFLNWAKDWHCQCAGSRQIAAIGVLLVTRRKRYFVECGLLS